MDIKYKVFVLYLYTSMIKLILTPPETFTRNNLADIRINLNETLCICVYTCMMYVCNCRCAGRRMRLYDYGTRLGVRKQRVGDEIYCAYGVGRWFHWVRGLEHAGLESFGRES